MCVRLSLEGGRERERGERGRERALSEEHRFSSNSISVFLILDCRCFAKRWFYGCWEDTYFISQGIILQIPLCSLTVRPCCAC